MKQGRSVSMSLLALCAGLALNVSQAVAQSDTTRVARFLVAPKTLSHNDTPAEDSVAWMRADTGRMIPGWRDFSRYTTPAMCWHAVQNVKKVIWQHGAYDTSAVALFYPERDTLPTAAVRVAQECGAKFTVDGTKPSELRMLQKLSLAMHNDEQARAVVNRRLSLAKTPTQRKAVLLDALDGYTPGVSEGNYPAKGVLTTPLWNGNGRLGDASVQPMRKTAALDIIASLDSMGNDAILERMTVHTALLTYDMGVFDTIGLKKEFETVRQLRSDMSPKQVQWWHERGDGMFSPYSSKLGLVVFGPRDSMTTAMNQVLGEFTADLQDVLPQTPEIVNTIRRVLPIGMIGLGKKAPPLQTPYVYGVNAKSALPVPGKVNLIYEVYEFGKDDRPNMPNLLANLSRLQNRYRADGLEITIVQVTHGYAWSSPPLTPEEEAKVYAWYYLDYEQMPVTLAVMASPFHRDAQGRRINDASPIKSLYPPMGRVLIGRDGTILDVGLMGWDSLRMEARIRQVLGVAKDSPWANDPKPVR
jgi:hypothetical protein